MKSKNDSTDEAGLLSHVSREWVLGISILTCVIFFVFGHEIFAGLSQPLWLALIFVCLFAVILASALGVVRHAEFISHRLGEPYGTIILTLSITAIEVASITAVMLHGGSNPTLVRDTMFSVVMIVMGGMVGLSLLLGAIRHNEQTFNLQGANAYLGAIVPLAVFTLVLPDFTRSTDGPTLTTLQKVMVGLMSAGLYAVFLRIQMGRHKSFFSQPELIAEAGSEENEEKASLLPHILLLFAYILPVVFLVEQLALPIDYVVETLAAPPMIGGVVMAILVATPEGIGGVKAALRNQLQISVNVFLGSVLATIGLTVPIMLTVSSLLGLDLVLGLDATGLVLLLLMMTLSIITFSSGRTHLLQGAVHLLVFVAFLFLLFEG